MTAASTQRAAPRPCAPRVAVAARRDGDHGRGRGRGHPVVGRRAGAPGLVLALLALQRPRLRRRRAALAAAAALEPRRRAAARDHGARRPGALQGSSSRSRTRSGCSPTRCWSSSGSTSCSRSRRSGSTGRAAAVLAILVATVVIAFVPWFFFSKQVSGATPLARCTAACPENPFLIADRPGAATHSGHRVARPDVFAVLCLLLLGIRLFVASAPAAASSSRSTRSPPRGPSPSAPTAWRRT